MKIRYIKKLQSICLCTAIILSVTACQTPSEKAADENSFYNAYTADADVFIEIPALRQYDVYTCGTTCVQMLMNWLFPYEGDLNLTAYEEELGTTEELGTPGDNIAAFFEENRVETEVKEDRSTDDLVKALDNGNPMLICLQAWSADEQGRYNLDDPSDPETYLAGGHWVICVGYEKMDDGYRFFFNDPSCVGHCYMDEAELENRWIDMDGDGNVYYHYGIEISGVTDYDPDGVYYME